MRVDLINKYTCHPHPGLPTHVWGCTTQGMANYNPLANGDDGSCVPFAPEKIYILNSSSDIPHYDLVKGGVVAGYGSDINSRIEMKDGGLAYYLEYLQMLTGKLMVFSYAGLGLGTEIADATAAYPDVLLCMPMGNNNYVELTVLNSIPVIVATGAGDTQNRTAYGNALEFWDAASTSSEANGIIGGKLLKIKETRNCGWWEARYSARMTASNGGVWDKFNGYGKIDVTAAINYAGTIIPDPYL